VQANNSWMKIFRGLTALLYLAKDKKRRLDTGLALSKTAIAQCGG
jgi:hypothetical protein